MTDLQHRGDVIEVRLGHDRRSSSRTETTAAAGTSHTEEVGVAASGIIGWARGPWLVLVV